MRENNRNPIERCRKMLPQFTTMNVIDGQAGLVSYSSLIFYSLTIDNILNIIVLLILAGVSIATLTGKNGILTQAQEAKEANEKAEQKEVAQLNDLNNLIENYVETTEGFNGTENAPKLSSGMIPVKYENGKWLKADEENKDNSWYEYGTGAENKGGQI